MKWNIERLDTCPSTNAELLERGTHGDVLVARQQTAARGRLGRQWVSPEGQAILSACLLPESTERFGLLPLAAGLALADTVPEVRLKWPNDGLLHGKKVAGILCEAADASSASADSRTSAEKSASADSRTSAGMRVVIGVGVNVETAPIEGAARLEGFTVDSFIEAYLANLATRVDQWAAGEDFLPEYRSACLTLGEEVRLVAPGGDVVGRAQDVDTDGSIIVDGKPYSAGDIIHLRLAE